MRLANQNLLQYSDLFVKVDRSKKATNYIFSIKKFPVQIANENPLQY